jgi:membrane-anchored protein YejM (alkaline phosphatase superfamily)
MPLLSLTLLLLQSFQQGIVDCLGYLHNDEVIMDYLESTLDEATTRRSPFFTISWATAVSHDDINGISFLDVLYANFLNRIIGMGYLKDTILIVMGDHGYQFGDFRETVIGYFEQNLPNMWIRLPPRIQKSFPHWQRSLEINSK